MEIRVAKKNNLIEVIYILRECSRQLIEKGVKYWNNSLADYNEISGDIDNGFVYLIVINNVPVGTATIKPDRTDSKVTILSRLAIYPPFQKKGLAQSMLKFTEDLAKKNGSNLIKGLTPLNDTALENLLEKNGFMNIGVQNEMPNEFVRIRFEKII